MKQILVAIILLIILIGCVQTPRNFGDLKTSKQVPLPPPPTMPGISQSQNVGVAIGKAVPLWASANGQAWAHDPIGIDLSPLTSQGKFDKINPAVNTEITGYDLVWSQGYYTNTTYILGLQSTQTPDATQVWKTFDIKKPDGTTYFANGGWIQVQRTDRLSAQVPSTTFQQNNNRLNAILLFACKTNGVNSAGYVDYDCNDVGAKSVKVRSDGLLAADSGRGSWMLKDFEIAPTTPAATACQDTFDCPTGKICLNNVCDTATSTPAFGVSCIAKNSINMGTAGAIQMCPQDTPVLVGAFSQLTTTDHNINKIFCCANYGFNVEYYLTTSAITEITGSGTAPNTKIDCPIGKIACGVKNLQPGKLGYVECCPITAANVDLTTARTPLPQANQNIFCNSDEVVCGAKAEVSNQVISNIACCKLTQPVATQPSTGPTIKLTIDSTRISDNYHPTQDVVTCAQGTTCNRLATVADSINFASGYSRVITADTQDTNWKINLLELYDINNNKVAFGTCLASTCLMNTNLPATASANYYIKVNAVATGTSTSTPSTSVINLYAYPSVSSTTDPARTTAIATCNDATPATICRANKDLIAVYYDFKAVSSSPQLLIKKLILKNSAGVQVKEQVCAAAQTQCTLQLTDLLTGAHTIEAELIAPTTPGGTTQSSATITLQMTGSDPYNSASIVPDSLTAPNVVPFGTCNNVAVNGVCTGTVNIGAYPMSLTGVRYEFSAKTSSAQVPIKQLVLKKTDGTIKQNYLCPTTSENCKFQITDDPANKLYSSNPYILEAKTVASCAPNCVGKTCGDNGCGGSCGTCTTGTCTNNNCVATTGTTVSVDLASKTASAILNPEQYTTCPAGKVACGALASPSSSITVGNFLGKLLCCSPVGFSSTLTPFSGVTATTQNIFCTGTSVVCGTYIPTFNADYKNTLPGTSSSIRCCTTSGVQINNNPRLVAPDATGGAMCAADEVVCGTQNSHGGTVQAGESYWYANKLQCCKITP